MFTEDFDLFFNDFTTTVMIDGIEIDVIFSNEFVDAEGIATTAPHLYIETSEVEDLELERKDEVLINESAYSIKSIENDGTGMSVVFLEKKWDR